MNRIQSIRDEVLLQLYAAGQSISLTPFGMARQAKRADQDFTEAEMRAGALFLVGQHLAEKVEDRGTGVERFTITSEGCFITRGTGDEAHNYFSHNRGLAPA